MYKKSPSWSIQGKKKQNKVSRTPSPFHYQPKQVDRIHQPSWKIGTSKRNQSKTEDRPDPGTYNAQCMFETTKYGKFDKQVKLKQKINCVPHSSQYSPNHQYIQKSPTNQKIGAQRKKQFVSQTPGPGAYIIKQKTLQNSWIGSKFPKRNRFQANLTEGPSPVTYSPAKIYNEKHVSFTKQSKFPASSQQKSVSPGRNKLFNAAAAYDSMNMFTTNGKGFSIASRYHETNHNEEPGPGSYDPEHIIFSSSPKHTFGSKYLHTPSSSTPGPLDYHINTLNSTNGFSIGKQQRRTTQDKKQNPGPGTYSVKVQYRNTPNYSIGTSIRKERQNTAPGPGSYDPKKQFVQIRPKSAKIGQTRRNTSSRNAVPGPGQYQSKKIRPQTANTIFGKTKRMKLKIDNTPGPGHYNSQTIFASRKKPLLLR